MSLPASRLCLTVPLLAFTPSNFEVVWASAAKPDVVVSRPTAITADKPAKRTLRNEPLMELLLVDGLCPGPRSGRGPCIRLVLGRVCSLHEPLGNQSRTLRLRRVRFDDNHSGRCSALMCHGSVWRRTPDDLNAISLTDANLSFEDHVKKVAVWAQDPSATLVSWSIQEPRSCTWP